jgi:branched-chain amino acid transport system substrate-binding protein
MQMRPRTSFSVIGPGVFGLALMSGLTQPLPASAQTADTIRFGASLPLTGALATYGKRVKDGYDFYARHVNDVGGIDIGGKKYKVSITYYDDESKTDTALKLYEKLITEDGIKYLLGPYGSGASMPVTALAERNRLPIVIAHGASTPIYTRGFKYVFGTLNTVDQYTDQIVRMASENNLKRLALINENALFPQLGIDAAAEQAKKYGMEVVYKETFPNPIADLSSQLIRIKEAKPDLIIAGGYNAGMLLLAKQIKEVGVSTRLLGFLLGPTDPNFIPSLKEAAENTLEPVQWTPNAPWKDSIFGYTAMEFAREFEKEAGYWPDYHPPQSVAALEVYHHAFQKAGSLDPQKVRDAIESTDIMTLYGPVRFNNLGENIGKSMSVVQVQDGKTVVVYPLKEAEAKLRLNH